MKAVNLFKALADETRLRLVHLFQHYELNVNEVVAIMDMGQSRISRHLKILTDGQLLTSRRDGLWTFYSSVSGGVGETLIQSVKHLFENEAIFARDLQAAARVLEARSRESVRFFDSIAEDWEGLKREIIGDTDLNGLIMDMVETAPPCETIVDMGCGTGDLLAALKGRAGHVIGVDKSPRMLEEARRRYADDGEDIDLRLGAAEHLPLREGEADLVVINMVLHHVPDPLKAFREVHRVLKADRDFIVVDLLSHREERMRERYGDRWLGFSMPDIRSWLQHSGFTPGKTGYFELKKGLKGFIVQSVKQNEQAT